MMSDRTALEHAYRRVPRRLLSLIFLLLVALFLAIYLQGIDWQKLRDIKVDWALVALGSVIALGFRYWMVMIWCVMLKALGTKVLPPFRLMSSIYAKAWMGRYIPGTVTWIAGKVYMASEQGISKSRLAVSSLLEGGMQVIAVMITSFILIGFDPRLEVIPGGLKALLLSAAALFLIFLYPPLFNKFVRQAYKIVRKREAYDELRINSKAVIRSFLLYAAGAFINGTASYFVTLAIAPDLAAGTYLYIVGAYGLAGAIGIATPFVPSGLGVRDGAQLLLLDVILPREIALAVTVFTRLWQVAVDVIFYFVAVGWHRLRPTK